MSCEKIASKKIVYKKFNLELLAYKYAIKLSENKLKK